MENSSHFYWPKWFTNTGSDSGFLCEKKKVMFIIARKAQYSLIHRSKDYTIMLSQNLPAELKTEAHSQIVT